MRTLCIVRPTPHVVGRKLKLRHLCTVFKIISIFYSVVTFLQAHRIPLSEHSSQLLGNFVSLNIRLSTDLSRPIGMLL